MTGMNLFSIVEEIEWNEAAMDKGSLCMTNICLQDHSAMLFWCSTVVILIKDKPLF